MKPKPRSVEPRGFNVKAYLESTSPARKVVKYRRGDIIFAQGDPANNVKYIQQGAIKLSVLSRIGKEAVVAMLAPGDFFGEGALARQSVRIGTATAMAASSVLAIQKAAMIRLLREEATFGMQNQYIPPPEDAQPSKGAREEAEDRRQMRNDSGDWVRKRGKSATDIVKH